MPKQIVTARIERIRERGRPRKAWTDKVGEDFDIIGIINWHTVGGDRKEWMKTVLEAKVHNGFSAWGGGVCYSQ